MRTFLLLSVVISLVACKKQVVGTVARYPDSILRPTSEPVSTPEATLIHTILRAPDRTSAVMGFYKVELEKRGAHQVPDGFADDNLQHQGGWGIEGAATVRDPSKPAVSLSVAESGSASTDIDIWESIPKAP